MCKAYCGDRYNSAAVLVAPMFREYPISGKEVFAIDDIVKF